MSAPTASSKLVTYKAAIIGYTITVAGLALIVLPKLTHASDSIQSICEVLGAALVPSGIISLANEYFLRRDIAAQMSALFDDYILGHMEELYRTTRSIAKIFDANPTSQISQSFADAKEEILLFNGWIPDLDGLQPGLRAAFKRDVRVRVLLLDPDSRLTAQRATEIGLQHADKQSYYTAIDLDNFVQFIREAGGAQCVEIRLFDELTIAPLYATESEMYVGWFYKGRRAVAGPVVRVTGNDQPLFEAMQDSFSRVWNRPETTTFYPNPSTT